MKKFFKKIFGKKEKQTTPPSEATQKKQKPSENSKVLPTNYKGEMTQDQYRNMITQLQSQAQHCQKSVQLLQKINEVNKELQKQQQKTNKLKQQLREDEELIKLLLESQKIDGLSQLLEDIQSQNGVTSQNK